MKLIAILATLMSFSAFAGDSYFICEIDNDYRIIDAYIGDGGIITDTYYDIPDDLYEFTFNTETFEFVANHYNIHGAGLIDSVEAKLEYYEPVKVTDSISCFVAD